MVDRSALASEVDALIAYADGVDRDDEELFERREAIVRRDPATVFEIGEALIRAEDPDRREMGVHLVGIAAVVESDLRDMALPILRGVLAADAEVGPLSAAILQLTHLDDEAAHDGVLANADHPDTIVRHVVAVALPTLGLDEPALAALCRLTADEDEDVRDWATFGLGEMTDADDPAIRAALFARVEDSHYETRIEAINGLCRRQDERVRAHLERELADPDHSPVLDEGTDFLDNGTGRFNWGDSKIGAT